MASDDHDVEYTEELTNALEVLTRTSFRANRTRLAHMIDVQPERFAPDARDALLTGLEHRYDVELTYDGGDYIADVNVDFFVHDKKIGRITTTCWPSLGKRKFTRKGRAMLQHDLTKIKGWRVTCGLIASSASIAVTWHGLNLTHVGDCQVPGSSLTGLSGGGGFIE